MKSVLTFIFGFLSLFFLEGFSRLIIAFYHRIEFSFYGLPDLPGNLWVIAIMVSILVTTWLVTMLILTIINKRNLFNAVLFAVILVGWRSIEIANSYQSEPVWYFITLGFMHLSGVTIAYFIYERQQKNLDPA